jgi:hypothetical protein
MLISAPAPPLSKLNQEVVANPSPVGSRKIEDNNGGCNHGYEWSKSLGESPLFFDFGLNYLSIFLSLSSLGL